MISFKHGTLYIVKCNLCKKYIIYINLYIGTIFREENLEMTHQVVHSVLPEAVVLNDGNAVFLLGGHLAMSGNSVGCRYWKTASKLVITNTLTS
jgi:hypothetical protein